MVLKYVLKVPHQCPKHHLKCQVIDFQVIHISLYDIVKRESMLVPANQRAGCYGLSCVPRKSYIELLPPSTCGNDLILK